MKFAPVCPIHIYEALALEGKQYIGDYFLLLAHDVLENKDRYREFFVEDSYDVFGSTSVGAIKKPFIIMDNSVVELGSSVSPLTLIEACNIVDADVLVIPDELCDGAKTSIMADKFIAEWMAMDPGLRCRAELMFVPQGADADKWRTCATNAAEFLMPHIKWVGIARNLTGRICDTRVSAVDFITHTFKGQVKIHMLGFSDNPTDDLVTCHARGNVIEGIDSAVPLRITEPLAHPLQDPGPRGSWWDTVLPTQQLFDNVLEARYRIGEIDKV